MRALAPLGALAALSLALLLALPLDRELSYGFQRNTTATPASAAITPADNGVPYSRRNIRFDSHGTACDAWLYTPAAATPAADGAANAAAAVRFPVVIMAHGLGAQKELGLHRFADAFAREGLAVLVFDYRTFGGSDGEPRHWASPRRHLEDWRAALRFVQSGALGPEYDTKKVALWGTSYAGGHVLVLASEQPPGTLAAVISMVPHLDGVEASKSSVRRRGLPASLRMLAAGLHDRLRAAASDLLQATAAAAAADPATTTTTTTTPATTGRTQAEAGLEDGISGLLAEVGRRLRAVMAPVVARLEAQLEPQLQPSYIKLVGLESEMALMQLSPEQLRSYFAKHPAVYEGGWRPLVLSRFTLETSSYSPIKAVPRVTVPVLFVSALRDKLCPPELVRKAAAALPVPPADNSSGGAGGGSEVLELDCTHFDAYLGEHLAAATQAMVRFLRRHMQLPPPPPPAAPLDAGEGAGQVGVAAAPSGAEVVEVAERAADARGVAAAAAPAVVVETVAEA